MSNCAKVSLTGRLTRDPEQKNWQGTTVISFTVAVNTTKKEGDKYISDFYNVSVWGKSGEYLLPRLTKGTMVQVYGDLVVQKYVKDDQERQSLSVRASDVFPIPTGSTEKKKDENKDDNPPF